MTAFARSARAEWRKFTTTPAAWISTVLVLVISLVVACMGAWGMRIMYGNVRGAAPGADVGPLVDAVAPTVTLASLGLLQVGLLLLMVQSVLCVTTEFGTGTIASTTLAVPRRWVTALSKSLVCGLWAAAVAVVTLVACILAYRAILPAPIAGGVSAFGSDALGLYWSTAVWAALAAVFCVGAGFVFRSSAAGVAAVLLWRIVLEPLAGALPKIGSAVAPWMPFGAAEDAVRAASGGEVQTATMPWPEPWMGLPWFGAVAFVVLALGTWAHSRRAAATG